MFLDRMEKLERTLDGEEIPLGPFEYVKPEICENLLMQRNESRVVYG